MARDRLAAFSRAPKQELLIYDPKPRPRRCWTGWSSAPASGVDAHSRDVSTRRERAFLPRSTISPGKRLPRRHESIRDGNPGRVHFIGRARAAEARARECAAKIGINRRQAVVIRGLRQTFHDDWALLPTGQKEAGKSNGNRPTKRPASTRLRAPPPSA